MATSFKSVVLAGQEIGDSQETVPAGKIHMPWRPVSAGYRVMVQFRDCQVMLVSMAVTRRDALRLADAWLKAHEEGGTSGEVSASAQPVSVYTEKWTATGWEVLSPSAGGYYRRIRRPQRGPAPRGARRRGDLYDRRRANVKAVLSRG